MAVRRAVDLKEFHEVVLFLAAADALHIKNFAEVGVVLVRDVD